MRRTLLPDLVLDASGAHGGVGVTIEGGRIVEVGPKTDGYRLPDRALAPGFVNNHSHAFQRGLRGRVEHRDPARPHDDFWSWREKMYELANSLDSKSIRRISERCYREMLSAGYTSVTEFHYIHHRPDGSSYDDPSMLAEAVTEAAQSAGIRLLLIPVAYARGGVPRFRDESLEAFLGRVDTLCEWAADRPLVEVGVAAHSVRAVPRDWLEKLAEYAKLHDMQLHIHADEQSREIQECKKEHELRPIELLAEVGFLGSRTTVVHATHAAESELDLLTEHGSGVCVCPTTEGNLGDGFLPAEGILKRGIPLSVGSDQHVRLDPFEELRELETNARRLAGRRNLLVAPGDHSPTPYLLRAGWRRKGLYPGDLADLLEIDLTHPEISDAGTENLTSALVFGAGRDVVAASWVAGECIYERRSA